MGNITQEMAGSDRPIIFELQRSRNPLRFEGTGKTGRSVDLALMPRPARLPSNDCPPGVIRFDMLSDDDTWATVVTPRNVSHIWL